MDNRKLLELAAEAAGYTYFVNEVWADNPLYLVVKELNGSRWNPLTDDGDTARLEAACDIDVTWFPHFVRSGQTVEFYADHEGDKNEARRYASVRAAAERIKEK